MSSTVYKGTNKFVNVDFNSLDINFNLQTWVVILDFFGIVLERVVTGGVKDKNFLQQTGRDSLSK